MKFKGNSTELIDLKGKTLMPGLIDNHLHHSFGGILLSFNWLMAEEWILPDRHIYPVIGKEDYLKELTKIEQKLVNPDEWLWLCKLFSWKNYKNRFR